MSPPLVVSQPLQFISSDFELDFVHLNQVWFFTHDLLLELFLVLGGGPRLPQRGLLFADVRQTPEKRIKVRTNGEFNH